MVIIFIGIGVLLGIIKVIYDLVQNDSDRETMRIYRQMVIEGRNALAMEELERNDAWDCRPYARGRAHAPELDPPSDLSFQEEPEEDE